MRRRKAAASKVRLEVRTPKFFVSSTMPDSSAAASLAVMSDASSAYCSTSVTSSEAEEANGSCRFSTGCSM